MTRILALVGEAYGGGGGIAQYNRDLFGVLAQEGCEIHILPRHGGKHPEAPPQGVTQSLAISPKAAYAAMALAQTERRRPDAVFCGHLFMAPLAAHLARNFNARLILQLHGIEAWDRPGASIREAVVQADLIACVSRDTRARLLSWSTLDPERAVVVSNTVGDMFTPGDRTAARGRFGLADEAVLLSVGRLDSREQYKGHDRVIGALPALLTDRPDSLYLIAGEGDDRARLEALAAATGVADRVRFLGPVPHEALPDLYRAADLFVLPSTREGFGIVFLEAMACGTPALGLAAGGAVDALADGELGVALADNAPLAPAIMAALAAPRRPDLAQAVKAKFGRDAFAQRVLDVFHRVRPARALAA